jgi:hypothetical protein
MTRDQLLDLHNVLSSPTQGHGLIDITFALASRMVIPDMSESDLSTLRSRVSTYTEPLFMLGNEVRGRLQELGVRDLAVPPASSDPVRDATPKQLAALHLALGIDILGPQPDGTVLARRVGAGVGALPR